MSPLSLVRILMAESLAAAGAHGDPDAAAALAGADPARLGRALDLLHVHRMLPLVAHALEGDGRLDALPPAAADRLRDALRRTRLTSSVLLRTLARVLAALDEAGVEPVIWKGILLADTFYPEPGARWMGDIDFSIEPDEVEATTRAFEGVGFHVPAAWQTPDAVYFENKLGVLFDVHHRVRLFEGRATGELTMRVKPRHVDAPHLRVLDPDAMVAHLVVHMDGHRGADGWLLTWIADLAFVLGAWGDRLDAERLAGLMPSVDHVRSLLRAVRLLELDFRIEPPSCLAAASARVEPYEFDALVRSRLAVQWGLPSPRGWARLASSRLGMLDRRGLAYPSLGEIARLPGDRRRERRLERQEVPELG